MHLTQGQQKNCTKAVKKNIEVPKNHLTSTWYKQISIFFLSPKDIITANGNLGMHVLERERERERERENLEAQFQLLH